jgi:transcriptional antiterminator NusG
MSDTPENLASNDAAPAPIDDGPMPVRPVDAADEPDAADETDEADEPVGLVEPVEREPDVVEVPEAPEIEEPPFEPADPTLRIGEAGPASDDPQGGQVEVLSAEEPEPELPSTIDAIGTGPTDRVVVQVDQEEPVIPPAEEETASDRTVEAPLEESDSMPVEQALEAATVPIEDQVAEALTEPEPAEPELDPSAEEPAAPEAEVTAAVAEPPAEEEAAPAASDPFRGPGDWYVVHTYAGYENKVKANLESRIHTMQMEDKIFNVHIPMEDVMEIKGGKKQVVQRKVFPGYLLVKMEYDNDSWYVVRNTPGVTGFVAAGTGSKPTPLSRREVEKILAVKKEEVKPQFRLGFEEGDVVRIVSGPFADFNGTISEINVDQSKLKVLVNIFDRETPVELGFDQVAKV